MKRDMDLIRAILLRVEEEYGGISITNLSIEGNSLEEVAVHCKMLEDAGLVTSCGINYADNGIYSFSVGGLTWDVLSIWIKSGMIHFGRRPRP